MGNWCWRNSRGFLGKLSSMRVPTGLSTGCVRAIFAHSLFIGRKPGLCDCNLGFEGVVAQKVSNSQPRILTWISWKCTDVVAILYLSSSLEVS